MITDRELLELAAKAAGFRYNTTMFLNDACLYGCFETDADQDIYSWNPLSDDGDALRLAVKLELDITFIDGETLVLNASEGGGDPYERTRRAIVRAAAAIGRAM